MNVIIYSSILSYASIVCAGSLTLSRKGATRNTEGTSLSDRAGSKLCCGTSAGNHASDLLNNGVLNFPY